jgi:serine/threonine protein kinase
VKLLDFGIAKSELTLSKTMTGQTLGTVIYMSPEQVIDPKRITGKSDLYSLGVTFYHALNGRAPYDETTGSEYTIQNKIVNEDLDLTKVPAYWKVVLYGCLIKKPEDRPELKARNFESGTVVDNPFQLSPIKPQPEPLSPQKPGLVSKSVSKWIFFISAILALILYMIFRLPSHDRSSEEKGLIVYETSGLYGYKDQSGMIIIHPRYEKATPFSGNRAKVTISDSVYYINTIGKIVELVKPKADVHKLVDPKKETIKKPENPTDSSIKEDAAWQQAKSTDSKASYEKYLRDYPNGLFKRDAKVKIKEFESEKQIKQETEIIKPTEKVMSEIAAAMILVTGGSFTIVKSGPN